MEKETCILCGEKVFAGLHVMGCLICFPCEKRLVHGIASPQTVRKMRAVHACVSPEG